MSVSSIYRILVGVDLSPMDERLIYFVSRYYKALTADKIYFIHVAPKLHIIEDTNRPNPYLHAPADETIAKDIEFTVKNYFSGVQPAYQIEIKEGNPAKEILNWSRIKDIDLIILGHDRDEDAAEVASEKIVNASGCSVLLLPEKSDYPIRKICVATDFSDVSLMALHEALAIAVETKAEVVCHHAYQVPSGYHWSGKNYDEYARVMQENVEKEGEEFLSRAGQRGVKIKYSLDSKNNPADCILRFAAEINADLLVAGGRERTAAAALFFGGVTEKLVRHNKNLPLLVVKKKNENRDFLDSIIHI